MKTAVILAGGLGTRLRPVTLEIPKPLIPIRGRTLTEHVLDVLKEQGVRHVFLAVGYMADRIKEHFGDGARFGVKIEYIVEEEPLGTGGWMHVLRREGKVPTEEFIVVNGDNLFDIDFSAMLDLHRRERAVATIALSRVVDVEHYGVAELAGSRILRFVEKPPRDEAPSDRINGGYYLFSPAVFDHLPEKRRFMFETDLFPKLAAEGLLVGYPSDAPWFDTGTFDRWQKVIDEWRTG